MNPKLMGFSCNQSQRHSVINCGCDSTFIHQSQNEASICCELNIRGLSSVCECDCSSYSVIMSAPSPPVASDRLSSSSISAREIRGAPSSSVSLSTGILDASEVQRHQHGVSN